MTTQFTLGLVRAAQGKDEEAEQLLRDALARAEESPFGLIEREALEKARGSCATAAATARPSPMRNGSSAAR